MINLTKSLKIALAQHDINRSQLAEIMGVPEIRIHRLTRRPTLTIKDVEALAEALQMPEFIRQGETRE